MALIGGAVVIVAVVIVGLIYFSGLVAGVNMYDDFNNPAYDGSYNKTLWEKPTMAGSVVQRNGLIAFSQARSGDVTGTLCQELQQHDAAIPHVL